MNVCVTRRSPTQDNRLEVQRFPLRVGDGHVHDPLNLVAVLQLTVGPQHLHHHVQGSGPWKCDMLQQRQVFLLSKLVTDGFSFPEMTKDIFAPYHPGSVWLPEKSALGKQDYILSLFFKENIHKVVFQLHQRQLPPSLP